MNLKGKIAVVTGASRGIGKGIAIALGKAGAKVVGTATSDGGAENISAYLAENDIQGKGMALNVGDSASVDAFIKTVLDEQGSIDVLVNNAGITQDNLLMRLKEDAWDAVINTNLTSIFRMSKAVLKPMMKARQGRVINISSVIGSMGNAGQANYAASKAGMEGFSRSMAAEVASRNITVNCVAPGYIATDMTDALDDNVKEKISSTIPMARMGSPEDIANAVLFLASDQAGYITGQTLHVNGGMYM